MGYGIIGIMQLLFIINVLWTVTNRVFDRSWKFGTQT